MTIETIGSWGPTTMPEPTAVVLDASVAIARLRSEEHTPQILDAFLTWSRRGTRLVVPRPFWWEVVNVLATSHGYAGDQLLEAVHELDSLQIESIDLDRGQLLLAISAVERFHLTAYDAQYLVLVETMDAELATLDRALAHAAGTRVVDLEAGGRGHRLSDAPAPYGHDVTWPDYKGASAYLAKLRVEAREAAAS